MSEWFKNNGPGMAPRPYTPPTPTPGAPGTSYGGYTPEQLAALNPFNRQSPDPSVDQFYGTPYAPPDTQPKPTITAAAFIAQWQQSHNVSEGIGGLLDAMKAAGYGNVSRFMYGATPSGNELLIDGQKFKVLSGENSSNPSWYIAGTNDSTGGGGGGGETTGETTGAVNQPFTYQPFTDQFTNAAFQAPTGLTEENDPGYQERLRLGTQAIDRGAAAKGTLLTGGTLQNEQQFGQALATNEYGNVYNRALQTYGTNSQNAFQQYQQKYNQYQQGFQNAYATSGANNAASQANWGNIFNQSAQNFGQNQQNWQNQYSLANLGLNAAAYGSNAAGNYANQYGNLVTNQGNANAAGQVGGANAWNQGLGTFANMGQNYLAGMYRRPPTSSPYGAGNPYGY